MAYVALGMLGLAIVAVSYYYQVSNYLPEQLQNVIHHPKSTASCNSTDMDQLPVSCDGQTSQTDPTANWKTYTNTDFGYEFKYPNNLNIQNDGGGAIFTDGADFGSSGYDIYVSPDQVGDVNLTSRDGYKVEKIAIPTITAYEITKAGYDPEFYIENQNDPGNYIKMGIQQYCDSGSDCKSGDAGNLLNQILSTIKFQNESAALSNFTWKTYADDSVTFEYPSDYTISSQKSGVEEGIDLSANGISTIGITKTVTDESADEIFKDAEYNFSVNKQNPEDQLNYLTIDGYKAIKLYYSDWDIEDHLYNSEITIPMGDTEYNLVFSGAQNQLTKFDQLVNSIKFK